MLVSRGARKFALQLCDAGQDWSEQRVARELARRGGAGALRRADVLVLVFDLGVPASLERARTHWGPLLRRCCPDAPLVLVGARADRPPPHVSAALVHAVSTQLGAAAYVQCSARTAALASPLLQTLVAVACPPLPTPVPAEPMAARPQPYAVPSPPESDHNSDSDSDSDQ